MIKDSPTINENSLVYLYLGTENSSTMISEIEMYKKVPAQRLEKIVSHMSSSCPANIPKVTPTGEKSENMIIMRVTNLFSSWKVLSMLIPRHIDSAPLCMAIAMAKTSAFSVSFITPRAIPSRIEWTPRPISRTNGVKLKGFFSVDLS